MRTLFLFLGLCLFVSSCRTVPLKADLFLERPKPHVELESGKVIPAQTVTLNEHFLGQSEVRADSVNYDADSVAFYSTGMDYFANTWDGRFAAKIIDGRINVFRWSRNYQQANYTPESFGGGGHYSYSQREITRHYIQARDTRAVYRFSHDNLARMIPTTSPSFHLLNSYKHTRRVTRCGYVLTGACIAGGAFLMAGGYRGLRLITGGVVLGAISLSIHSNNNSKLTRALIDFNDEKAAP